MTALFQESGGSNQDRIDEAQKLIDRLYDTYNNGELTNNESQFVESIESRLQQNNPYISPKQIFWLRDIASKYDV